MEEPPKIPKNKLLEKISGTGKSKRSPREMAKAITPEATNRYAKWWEWRLIGMSLPQIQKKEKGEGREFNVGQIRRGLDKYADLCADEAGRTRRLAQHKGFVDQLRLYASTRIRQLLGQNEQSGGKGIPHQTMEKKLDSDGRITSTSEKTTHEPIDKSLTNWMRFALELDRYSATIDGLMVDIGANQQVDHISMDLGSFLGNKELEYDTDIVEVDIEGLDADSPLVPLESEEFDDLQGD